VSTHSIDQLSNEIIKRTSSKNIFYFWKGRVGLYALLKAMDVKAGDEVILPAYTCVVVPNAILYLGAKPVYIDVNPDTYNMDFSCLQKSITKNTKVIICQNTYGLSTDLDKIHDIAQEKGIFTIEDCTHGFGGTYNGVANAFYCDASFFSTQWNKPFSTGIGGFSITSDKTLSKKMTELSTKLLPPTKKELWNLRVLYIVKRYLLNDFTYWPLVHFYRWLSHNTPVVGSSSIDEINSTKMPDDYFKAFSHIQAKEGIRNLEKLSDDLVNRKKNALIYTDYLKKNGKNHVDKKYFSNHSFLKYPLLVKDRGQFLALAEKAHIELGEWFLSPLHPVKGDLSTWGFESGKFPVAEYLSSHIVNLPTTPTNINKVVNFLKKYSELIMDL